MSHIRDRYFSLPQDVIFKCENEGVNADNIERICSRICQSILMSKWFSSEVYEILLSISI